MLGLTATGAAEPGCDDAVLTPFGQLCETSRFDYYTERVTGERPQGGVYPTSPYGTFHQSGNVEEWVSDWYDPDYYWSEDEWVDPQGPLEGDRKVAKGGYLGWSAAMVRIAQRGGTNPNEEYDGRGLRCARSAP